MSDAAQDRAKAAELAEGDVIRALSEQHARVRELFSDVRTAGLGPGQAAALRPAAGVAGDVRDGRADGAATLGPFASMVDHARDAVNKLMAP